jgi:hypothetical protein
MCISGMYHLTPVILESVMALDAYAAIHAISTVGPGRYAASGEQPTTVHCS